MNLADQIESIARRATAEVAAASQRFTHTQRQLAHDLAEYQAERRERERDADDGSDGNERRYDDGMADRRQPESAAERTRAGLRRFADDADVATPRVMLPAHLADANPHSPATDDLPSTRGDDDE